MRLRRTWAYWLVVAGAGLWSGAVFLAPYARSRGWAAAPLLYAFFEPICHQLPERSFACFGHPLAVCHRCLGLYLGGSSGLVAWPSLPRLARPLLDRPRWVLAFFIPLLADVALGANTPASRFATGLVAGLPVALLLLAAVDQIVDRLHVPREETYVPR
jgi:uncharacterized membrane protein